MEVLGRVTQRISDELIRVAILRSSACGGKCAECSTSCGSKTYIITKNYDKAQKNDIVKIESDDKKVLILAFFVFIVPLLSIFLIYNILSSFLDEALTAVFSFLGGVFFFIITVIMFRKLKMPESKLHYESTK